jgi:NDP-sugar pyrophosphorylase family protein
MNQFVSGIFMAAGKGSRLQPFTDTTPKPLARVKGQTLLEINMSKAVDIVDEFVIVTNWLEDQIINYIGDSYAGKPVKYAHQDNPKGGTLDAFRTGLSMSYIESTHYFVSNTDNICGDLFYSSLKASLDSRADTTFALAKQVKDLQELKKYGIFRVDENFKFIEIVEKPQEFVSELVNIGLYLFPSFTKKYISEIQTPEGREEYLIDLLNVTNQHADVEVIGVDDQFIPITNLADLEKANQG